MIIIAVTSVTLLFATAQGIKSSCNIPPVNKGNTAILTCNFEVDIRYMKYEFQVHRDCLSHSKPQETILFCGWNDEMPDCHKYDRVTLAENVTNTLQVMIRNVTKDDEGRYECLKLPFLEEEDTLADCIFVIKDLDVTSRKQDYLSTLDPQNLHNSNSNGEFITVNDLIGAVIGTFILTTCIIAAISTACFCMWIKRKQNKYPGIIYSSTLPNESTCDQQKSVDERELEKNVIRLTTTPDEEDDKDVDSMDPLLYLRQRHANADDMYQTTSPNDNCLLNENKLKNDTSSNSSVVDIDSISNQDVIRGITPRDNVDTQHIIEIRETNDSPIVDLMNM